MAIHRSSKYLWLLSDDEIKTLERLWGSDLYDTYWLRLVNKYKQIYNILEDDV